MLGALFPCCCSKYNCIDIFEYSNDVGSLRSQIGRASCREIADEQTKRLRNIEKVLVAIAVSVLGLSLEDLDLEE